MVRFLSRLRSRRLLVSWSCKCRTWRYGQWRWCGHSEKTIQKENIHRRRYRISNIFWDWTNIFIEKRLPDQVIKTLHGVLLAIEQAGAYLHFSPSLTTRVLKTLFEKLSSPNTQADILAKIPKRSIWYYEKHRSVIDTFSLLKTSLARNNGDALNILRISASLAQGEILFCYWPNLPLVVVHHQQ